MHQNYEYNLKDKFIEDLHLKNTHARFPAVQTNQQLSGNITNAVTPRPMKIPCSKNPTAWPIFCPVGFNGTTAFSLRISVEFGSLGTGAMIVGREVLNIVVVYLGCSE